MLASSDVLFAVRSRLEAAGFAVEADVVLGDKAGETVQLLASRRNLSWRASGFILETVVVKCAGSVTPAEVLCLCDAAFKQAKKRNTLPLIRGWGIVYFIVPCLIVEQVSPELLRFVTSPPRKRVALFDFPLVFDLAKGDSYYLNSTPFVGAGFFSNLRALANVMFPGARAQPSGPPIASPGPN